jgi:hypothetical protein
MDNIICINYYTFILIYVFLETRVNLNDLMAHLLNYETDKTELEKKKVLLTLKLIKSGRWLTDDNNVYQTIFEMLLMLLDKLKDEIDTNIELESNELYDEVLIDKVQENEYIQCMNIMKNVKQVMKYCPYSENDKSSKWYINGNEKCLEITFDNID